MIISKRVEKINQKYLKATPYGLHGLHKENQRKKAKRGQESG